MSTRMVRLPGLASLILAFASSQRRRPRQARPTFRPRRQANPTEPHRQIREARASLGGAKEHLEHAARDFGGHRGETVRASEEAIRQLELRLKYDKDRAAREMLRFSRKQISSKKKTQPNLFSARAFLSLDA